MRNFERQADLYSENIMGTPFHTVNSLEKIALLSGRIRDLPSWHHFSIKERVECLLDTLKKPDLARRHNRFIAISFVIYLICTLGLGYLLNFSPLKQDLYYRMAGKTLHEQVIKEPDNIILLQGLAMFYHERGKYSDAKAVYERILELDSKQPTALNNLAWLLATVPDDKLKDPKKALTATISSSLKNSSHLKNKKNRPGLTGFF
jgi:tetratricopeptide (TPR) repeat protein